MGGRVDLDVLTSLLSGFRYQSTTESAVQNGVEEVLRKAGVAFEREVRLSEADRIDFLVGDCGIECKIGGSLADVTRQLFRYAGHDQIGSLVLVTSRIQLMGVPQTLNGVDVRVVELMGGIV